MSVTLKQQLIPEQFSKTENFPITLLAPTKYKKDLQTIYQFARQADNIADNAKITDKQAIETLSKWQKQLYLKQIKNELWMNLYDLIERKKLPTEEFERLLQAFINDRVNPAAFKSHSDTLAYCRLSAIPIGRILMALSPIPQKAQSQKIDRLCIGLQLLNFYQDIAYDHQVLSRQYIEQEDLDNAALRFKDLFNEPDSWYSLKNILDQKLEIYLSKNELENFLSWDFFSQTLLTYNFAEKARNKLRLTDSIFHSSKLKWYDLTIALSNFLYDRSRLLFRYPL